MSLNSKTAPILLQSHLNTLSKQQPMGDTLNTRQTNSTDQVSNTYPQQEIQALFFENIQVETLAQKRALSYAKTIYKLFNQVMNKQQPADRVVGEYFRVNKKHGSKDRRVIRESLFALFRWWGWLRKFDTKFKVEQANQTWFTILTVNARLESHTWSEFISSWSELANINKLDYTPKFSGVFERSVWLNNQFSQVNFTIDELVPKWFWEVFQSESSEQRLALVESLSSRPPIWGRVQNIALDDAIQSLLKLDITAAGSEYFSDSINLGNKNINLNCLPLYKEGKLEIQDLGSQVVGQICQPKADDNWWDSCSGAGGKSLQLRSIMLKQNRENKGSITASDIRRKPLEELTKRAKRACFKGIITSTWKSHELPVPNAHFDGVLVDAPCSCTGTWRRNPDMRWTDTINSVLDKPSLQLDILSRSSKAVKPGATLVYATCSLSPLENEEVVKAFLAKHDGFSLEVTTHPFTGTKDIMHTVMPHQADTDGMFVARMVKHS